MASHAAQSQEAFAALSDRIVSLEAQLAGHARQRAELVHLVSHELRTPITVISGFCRLLREESHGALGEDQRRFVGEILRACLRLDGLVGDLLDAGTDAETPFTVVPQPADLHELLTGQLEALAPLLEERGMKLEAPLRAQRTAFAFDAVRIEQVVTNLMSNALRYGRPSGVIRLSTADLPADAERPARVEVAVEDDGPGIPEADRERLFAPYVRGDSGADTAGLGIGLSIARRIVEAHRGRIRVEEGALGGARFCFELPCEAPEPEEDGFR